MRNLLVGTLVLVVAKLTLAVGSGGYTNQTVGARALGMGNAFTAVADDPSALFFNPAGISEFEKQEVLVGGTFLSPKTTYKSPNGQETETASKSLLSPYAYYTIPFNESFFGGLALNSPFGLETHWPSDGPFNSVATDSRLHYFQIQPTITARINDRFSFGGGPRIALVNARLSSALNVTALNFILRNPSLEKDGSKTLDASGNGLGYTLAGLVKLSKFQKLGLTYRSPLKAKLSGSTNLSGLSGESYSQFGGEQYSIDTETVVYFPQSVTLGYALKAKKSIIAIDLEWTDYTNVENINLKYSGESNSTRLSVLNINNPTQKNWGPAWSVGVGLSHNISEMLDMNAGYFFLDSSVPNATWDPSVPEEKRHSLTFGVSVNKSPFKVNLSSALIMFVDREVDNDVGNPVQSVDGEYETFVPTLSLDVGFSF